MPELPEVETLCRQMQEKLCGQEILAGEVYDDKLSGIKNFKKGGIVKVERQGKTIAIHLDNGYLIKIHLRMTGRLLWQENAKRPEHSRWKLSFSDGYVYLVDPRRFATVKIEKTRQERQKNDLMVDFNAKKFLANQAGRKVNVKTLLMDPEAVAGVGNIYACEILHSSGISPLRQASNLSKDEWNKIFSNARRILKKGIKKRGTSISDWRDLYGCPGENQNELKAYGQEGKCCPICGSAICRIKQGGRSTFYCPGCQK